jgi:hypothetical protein
MNTYAKLAIAAAAVMVVVIVGINLLPGGGTGVGGPGLTPSPTPTASPSPASAPRLPYGSLEPGTRYAASGGDVAFTFEVPADGWANDNSPWLKGHGGTVNQTFLTFYAPTEPATPGVFADPCVHEDLRTFAPSLAGEAEALASVPGTELVSGPTDVTVGGRAAKAVVIATPSDPACAISDFWLVYNTADAAQCGDVTVACTSYPTWAGETIRSWFVDVDGVTLAITAEVRDPDATPDLERELQQIVDSIQFE